MSTPAKRLRSLSPTSPRTAKRARAASSSLSILSWNIENPKPYLTSASQSSSSKSIASYFGSKSTRPGHNSTLQPKAKADAYAAASDAPALRQIFSAHGYPHICCLQEVRALSKDKEMIRQLRDSANTRTDGSDSPDSEEDDDRRSTEGPRYTAHFSLCQANGGGKRFGVATYVSSDFKYQYTAREVDWDAEGRVVILSVPSLHLAIVNVYALNGSEYAWKDPKTGVVKGTRSERKREFNRLLMKECQALQEQGYRLVMVGDWNITRTAQDCFPRLRTEEPHAIARKEFNEEFMPALKVVDIFRVKYPDKKAYSWFSPGNGYRVDYALLSEEMEPATASIDYLEEPRWRYKSDHAPFRLVLKEADVNHSPRSSPQLTSVEQWAS